MISLLVFYALGAAVVVVRGVSDYRRSAIRPRRADWVVVAIAAAFWLPFLLDRLWPRTVVCDLAMTPWAPPSWREPHKIGGLPELRRMLRQKDA